LTGARESLKIDGSDDPLKEAFAMRFVAVFWLCVCLVPAAALSEEPTAPVAPIEPHELKAHGQVRIDDYYWLKDRGSPEVSDYLEAENAYTDVVMAPFEDLEEELFEEIKGRIKQTDESVPYFLDGYYYYTRTEDGKSYRFYCRRKGTMEAKEEVMLDVNALAEGHDHMRVRGVKVSTSNELLAYATDTVGRRIYTLHFKNLATGEALEDVIPEVTGSVAWANDNRTVFYGKQDLQTLRSYQVYRHVLGTDLSDDVLVYEETDTEFSCYVWKTKSKAYIMIGSYQTLSTEFRTIDADRPESDAVVFLPREPDHEYSVTHYKDRFYIRTNWEAENFRLMSTPVEATAREHWVEVIPHRDDVLLEGMEIFADHLVVEERRNGLIQIRIRPWSGEDEHYLDFGEPAYLAYTTDNEQFETTTLRYVYMSMTTPKTVYDYDMGTREKTLLKQDEVLGGFDSADYVTERLYATARDGERVPISIVYRKGMRRDGASPLLLYGYGSYGYSMDAYFSAARLSLLDRGFVYAIAHVRGGQEMGRRWYEDGKLLKKKNTFTDFIDCAEFLVNEGYTGPDRLYAMGGSAGGLLVGAVANMRPDLFDGIVAHVPWVDVVTTMMDPDIPLTTSEYDEWGDPADEEYYEYMLSYSPLDNVTAQDYPNMLVTTGLHDSQVQYWEAAKWVAKLRATKTDDNLLLLRCHMDAGHSGGSGRYRRYRETAFDYAFLLRLAGLAGPSEPSP
jgi:oligopeptidase B